MCLRRAYRCNRAAALIATVLALAALGATAQGALADAGVGSWSTTGAMLQPWSGGQAITLASGRVLALGGDSNRTATELYDPATGTWAQGPDLPSASQGWTVAALADGGALLVGNTACSGSSPQCIPTAAAYRLDSAGSAWTAVASMHDAHARPAMIRLADGRVLVAGGFGSSCPKTALNGYSCQPIASAEVYDPQHDQWTTTAALSHARGGAVGTLLSDGTVLVVGGDRMTDPVRYDPVAATWSAAGQSAHPRSQSLLFSLTSGRALALEGDTYNAEFFGSMGSAQAAPQRMCDADPEAYSTATSNWTAAPAEPGGDLCPNGAILTDGQVLIGSVEQYDPSTRTAAATSPYVLDAQQRCWSTTAPPPAQLVSATVVALADGRALVFGGADGSGNPTAAAEVYTPGNPSCASAPPPGQSPPPGPTVAQSHFTGVSIATTRLQLNRGGRISVLVRCPATATGRCTGVVTVALVYRTTGGAARRLTLGSASFAIRSSGHLRLAIRVSRRGRRRAAAQSHPRVVVTTTARDQAGRLVRLVSTRTLRVA